MMVSQPFGEMSSKPATKLAPALFTSTSRPPNDSTVASTSASTASRSVTSHSTASALPPSSRMPSATGSTFSCSREHTTTSAPSAANRSATARPMPLDAPVTTAVPETENLSGMGVTSAPPRIKLCQRLATPGGFGGGTTGDESAGERYSSTSSYFWTFPVVVRGSSSTNSTSRGCLYSAMLSRQYCLISSAVTSESGVRTMYALTVSPRRSSGMPTTA